MADRKENLLKIIIEEYVRSANPVGSSLVVEKYFPDLSSATIRNDMSELEERGLICQPHISAGRVPTVRGYKYYLDYLITPGKISKKNQLFLDELFKKFKADNDNIKGLAKKIADLSEEAVLVGFAPRDVYYTGLSNLFRQPEFSQVSLIYSLTEIIDHLDEVMANIFNQVENEVRVLLGEENPFGVMSAAVLTKYQIGGRSGLIGILGPNRMNYIENINLIDYSRERLNKIK